MSQAQRRARNVLDSVVNCVTSNSACSTLGYQDPTGYGYCPALSCLCCVCERYNRDKLDVVFACEEPEAEGLSKNQRPWLITKQSGGGMCNLFSDYDYKTGPGIQATCGL